MLKLFLDLKENEVPTYRGYTFVAFSSYDVVFSRISFLLDHIGTFTLESCAGIIIRGLKD